MKSVTDQTYTGEVALFYGPDKTVDLVPVEWPSPEGEEILVKITHCAICRSDVHTMCGRRQVETPTVLGHEIIGKVEATGDEHPSIDLNGETICVGDRVTWAIYAHCGTCYYCQNGLPQKCKSLFKYGHEPVQDNGAGSSGGMANYIILKPGTPILKIPESIKDQNATPINCAVATSAGLLRESRCKLQKNTVMAVMGGGYVGLSAVALAKDQGCGHIIVFEPNEYLHTRCLAFGASAVFSPGDPTAIEWLKDNTDTGGVDLVLELAGSTEAAQMGSDLLRVGGCLMLAGTVFPSPPLSIDPNQIVRRCLTIKGLHNYQPEDLITATRFMSHSQAVLPWDDLIGEVFSLKECNAAIQFAKDHPGKRAILCLA